MAFTLYWNPLHKQIRVEGTATKVDAMTSEKYFRERPRANQVGFHYYSKDYENNNNFIVDISMCKPSESIDT